MGDKPQGRERRAVSLRQLSQPRVFTGDFSFVNVEAGDQQLLVWPTVA